jgi:hypothetical protein
MSYNDARKCFEDNLNRVDHSSDPLLYNLYGGLRNLSLALEADMTKIQRSLSQIATRLQRLEQK